MLFGIAGTLTDAVVVFVISIGALCLGIVQLHNGIINGLVKRRIAVSWRRRERVYVDGIRARRAGLIFCVVGLWLLCGGGVGVFLTMRKMGLV